MGPADWINAGLNTAQLIFQIAHGIYTWVMMNNLLNGAWLYEQARKICIEFDVILISLAEKVYSIFCQIVGGTLLTPEIIDGIMGRMYLLIGILIFFRIAITMIRYIVAPETFLDDKVGAGNLVKRVIIGCILIIAIPLIFSTATKLQSAIINDKIIERIILPDYAYKELTDSNEVGRRIAMVTFQGLFNWNQSVSRDLYPSVYSSYSKAIEYENMSLFNKKYINEKTSSGDYVIYYIPILSTAAVGYVLYTLLKYTLEIAFRSFRLSFLQIISPFVIVNYMLNPSNDETIRKWTRTTISTYVLMFVRVITLWFMALIAYYLKNGIPLDEGGATSLINSADPLVKTVILLGLFAFLKELPKLLSEMLGLDLQENETITGLMQQGVNMAKGFAMGKVGMDFAKKQLGWNIGGAALSGAAGAAGGVADVMKNKSLNPGQKIGAAMGTASIPMAKSFQPVVGTIGSAMSSSMGSTVLSPIAQSGSVARASEPQRAEIVGKPPETKKPREKESDEPKTEKPKTPKTEEPKIPTVLAPEEEVRYSSAPKTSTPVEYRSSPTINVGAEVSENIFNNNDNHSYISSDGKIDLSGTSNPIVQQITTEVNNQLSNSGSNNINVSNDTVTQVIRETVSDPSHVSKKEVEVITQKVYEQAYTTTTPDVPNIPEVTYTAPEASYTPIQSPDDRLRGDKPLTPPTYDPNNIPYQNTNPNNNRDLIDE